MDPDLDWNDIAEPAPEWDGLFAVAVPFRDSIDREWARAFVHLADAEHAEGWGRVSIQSNCVEIDGVRPGAEEALRSTMDRLCGDATRYFDDQMESARAMARKLRGY